MDRQTLTIGAVLLAVVVVGLGVFFYFSGDDSASGPAAITGPGRAAEARGVIAEIQQRQAQERPPETEARSIAREPAQAEQAVDGGAVAVTPEPAAAAPAGAGAALDEAFEQAKEFQAAGQLDNAQVLFFFNARQGHGPSAFELATMNDPLHHSPETSLLDEPDAFQAHRWYTAALEGGIAAAGGRLDALRQWAEEAAAAGDSEAERLLLLFEE